MKPLDSLESNAVIEIYREGGIAFIPKLSGPRRVELSGMSDDKRREICQLINKALPYAQEKKTPVMETSVISGWRFTMRRQSIQPVWW